MKPSIEDLEQRFKHHPPRDQIQKEKYARSQVLSGPCENHCSANPGFSGAREGTQQAGRGNVSRERCHCSAREVSSENRTADSETDG